MLKRLIRGSVSLAAIGLLGLGAWRSHPSTILQAASVEAINYLMALGDTYHAAPPAVNFWAPQGVAYDADGRLYVSDTEWFGTESNRVRVFGPNIVSNTNNGYLYDVVMTGDALKYPVGLALDANGKLVVADGDNNRVVVFSAAGDSAPVELATVGEFGNYDPLDGGSSGAIPSNPVTLNYPTGVALKPGTQLLQADTAGRLAVADLGNHRVVVLDSQLKQMYDFGGYSVDAAHGTLQYPWGVAVDGAGQYYVADSENNRVQVFREVGTGGNRRAEFVRVFGSAYVPGARRGTFVFGSDPGDMSVPNGLNFDTTGRLWVADSVNHRVMRIDVTRNLTAPISLIPCSAVPLYQNASCMITTSDNQHYEALVMAVHGAGGARLFYYPQSVAVSPTGGLAVASTDNHLIQLFESTRVSVDFVGPGTIELGPHTINRPVEFSVSLTNNGGVPVTATVMPTANLNGLLAGTGTLPIAVGQTQTFSFTFTPNQLGALSFQVAADATANVLVGARVNVGTLTLDGGTVVPVIGPPSALSCSASGSPTIWPPNHKMVAWNPVVTVSDAAATFELFAFYSNEGDASADMTEWELGTPPDTSGFVRAERSGNGTGRVYTLVYRATDPAGNTAPCLVTATVPHDQSGKSKKK